LSCGGFRIGGIGRAGVFEERQDRSDVFLDVTLQEFFQQRFAAPSLGQKRLRYYRLTNAGRNALAGHREDWSEFLAALQQAAGLQNA
jgi:hypothetical protein